MVRSIHLKECGSDAVLKPIIDDLKSLSHDGFTIGFDGTEQNIKVDLATISCDNLSAHMIGGFSTHPIHSGRICRLGMAFYSDVNNIFVKRILYCEPQKSMLTILKVLSMTVRG